jgi:hypothetical protein
MMNLRYLPSVAAVLLVGCAATSAPVPGMTAGKFTNFECVGGRFSARAAEDGSSVRVRALHGSAELDRKSAGVYEGEGYRLETTGSGGVTLMHNGKSAGSQCKAV